MNLVEKIKDGISELRRKRQNRKDANTLFNRARNELYSWKGASCQSITQGVKVEIEGETHLYSRGFCYRPVPSTPEYEQAHDKITERFIYQCLDNGMGLQDRSELLRYALPVGVALSERDSIVAIAFMTGINTNLDQAIIRKDLVEMAVTLVGLDRNEGRMDVGFNEHYGKLVECYNIMINNGE